MTAITFAVLCLSINNPGEWFLTATFFSVLIFIFFYDLRFKEIHDAVLIPAIVLALIAAFVSGDWQSASIGALFGYTFFALQYYLSKGKWVGAGDMRIGAFIGAMWRSSLI